MALHRPVTRARWLAPVATIALALAVAACGGSAADSGVVSLADPSATPDPAASPSASVDPEEAMLEFERCMREHGVDIHVSTAGDGDTGGRVEVRGEAPAPGEAQPDRGAGDLDKLEEADEACRHLLPAAGRGDPNATMDPELADQLLAFAQCMRDHGIDFRTRSSTAVA
jgi:hypothetical protein